MANKYTKTPNPPKQDLEDWYHNKYKTQSEIAAIYLTTQKVVCRWFRDLGIKSRIPFKRNQLRENNFSWKGDNVSYAALHYRVRAARGKAVCCEECGRDDNGINYDWANMTGNYTDVNDYRQMCRSCHFKMDGHKKNFPNNKFTPNINKRKLINEQQKQISPR